MPARFNYPSLPGNPDSTQSKFALAAQFQFWLVAQFVEGGSHYSLANFHRYVSITTRLQLLGKIGFVIIVGAEFQGLLCQPSDPEEQIRSPGTLSAMILEVLMRTYILAIATATLFAIPTAAFSESIYVGPGGVKIGPSYGHHRYYNRYEGLYNHYESGR
jgi:hypothetical protein